MLLVADVILLAMNGHANVKRVLFSEKTPLEVVLVLQARRQAFVSNTTETCRVLVNSTQQGKILCIFCSVSISVKACEVVAAQCASSPQSAAIVRASSLSTELSFILTARI